MNPKTIKLEIWGGVGEGIYFSLIQTKYSGNRNLPIRIFKPKFDLELKIKKTMLTSFTNVSGDRYSKALMIFCQVKIDIFHFWEIGQGHTLSSLCHSSVFNQGDSFGSQEAPGRRKGSFWCYHSHSCRRGGNWILQKTKATKVILKAPY